MIQNSQRLKIANIPSRELFIPNTTLQRADAQAILDTYLSEGYTLYDVVAEGGFANVSSKTATKILCVWKGAIASLSYSVSPANFTGKTVVILGVRLDNANKVLEFRIGSSSLPFEMSFNTSGDFSNLTFRLMGTMILNSSLTLTGLTFINCSLIGSTHTPPNLTNASFQYCTVNPAGRTYHWTTIKTVSNVDFDGAINLTSTVNITFKNCLFNQYGSAITFSSGSYFDFWNCFFKGAIMLESSKTNSPSLTGLYGARFYGNVANYELRILTQRETAQQNESLQSYFTDNCRTSALNPAKLPPTNTDFETLTALVSTEFRLHYSIYGRSMRNYYLIDFLKSYAVTDPLKNFNPERLFLIHREDLESGIGLGSVVKNLSLYESDQTTPRPYETDENFFILAQGEDDEVHILLYLNGEFRKTAFSNPMEDTAYTVLSCFQIWEIEKSDSLRNLFPIADSPLVGSICFNNYDNEVVI